jgi:hypothetical protein
MSRFQTSGADIVLASFPINNWTPDDLIQEIGRLDVGPPVLIHDPFGTIEAVNPAKARCVSGYHRPAGSG